MVLYRVTEVESRFDARHNEVRAGGRFRINTSAVERSGCTKVGPCRGGSQGHGPRETVADNSHRSVAPGLLGLEKSHIFSAVELPWRRVLAE